MDAGDSSWRQLITQMAAYMVDDPGPAGSRAEQPGAGRSGLIGQILQYTLAGVAVVDPDLRFLYVNPAMARMNATPVREHLGRTIVEVVPGLQGRQEGLRKLLLDGVTCEFTSTARMGTPDGERQVWRRGVYHRLEDDGEIIGLLGIVFDVTAHRAEHQELERARARLALLDTAATRIGTTLELDATCRELADVLVPVLADAATVEVLDSDLMQQIRPPLPGVLRLRRAALAAGPGLDARMKVFGAAGEYIDYQPGTAIPTCLQTGRPLMENMASDTTFRATAPNAARVQAYRAAGIHSAMVVPLAVRDTPLGTLTLVRVGDSPPFTSQDVVVAQDLAQRAALRLEQARHYTREHAVARQLQHALLSEPAGAHPDLEIASHYLPADQSAQVGGDWFDTIPLPQGRTLLVMGDVMGHGVEAAVAMSQYRSLLRVTAARDLPPHQILNRVDAAAIAAGLDRVATCLLVLIDPHTQLRHHASAGHLPPALLHPDRRTELLPTDPGPPLGTGTGGYRTHSNTIHPDAVLLLYTDGLVERRGEDIDDCLQRLADLRLPTDTPLPDLLHDVLSHLVTDTAEDDIALLAARRNGTWSEPGSRAGPGLPVG